MFRRMRKLLRALSSVVLVPVIVGFVLLFIDKAADQLGLFDNAGGTISMVLDATSEFIRSPWILYPAALFVGFVTGIWADDWMKKIDAKRTDLPGAWLDAVEAAKLAGAGEVSSRVVRGGAAVWHEYRRGACVWFKRTHRLHVLPFTTDRVPFSVQDPGASGYHDANVVRKRLGIPENEEPPLGGIAAAWEREPENWAWLGERKWRTTISNDDFLYQEFESGFVAGPFPRDAERPQKRFVWVVFGKRWGDVEL